MPDLNGLLGGVYDEANRALRVSAAAASNLDVTSATAGTDVVKLDVTGDTQDRFVVNADGKLEWGPGNAALDVNLYRSAANRLKTDDEVEAAGLRTGIWYLDSENYIYLNNGVQFSAQSAKTHKFEVVGTGNVLTLSSTTATLLDAVNLAFETTTGTKIGTSDTQKIGFWNATPVVKQNVSGSRTTGVALTNLLTTLALIGLITDGTVA